MAILEKLADENPAVTQFGLFLAITTRTSASCCGRRAGRRRRRPSTAGRWRSGRSWPTTTPPYSTSAANWRTAATSSACCLSDTGKPAEAEAEFRQALAIRQKLADDFPKVPDYRNDVASHHTNTADVLRRLGRTAVARDGYERAIAIRERLVQENPEVKLYRSHLAGSLRRRGLARRELGDPAGAAADARRALGLYDGLPSRTREEWYETACCHAALATLAGQPGAGISAAEGNEEAARAMDLLHKAVEMGYRDANAFRTESALDPLRDRDHFKVLMMDLAFPAEPFAKAR